MAYVAQLLEERHPGVTAVMEAYTEVLSMAIGSISNIMGVRSIHVGGDIALLGAPFLQMLRDALHRNFIPLNKADRLRVELFVNDYEQVRLAATLMCLDAIFRK